MFNEKLKFYNDTLVIEALLGEPIIKTAQFANVPHIGSFLQSVFDHVKGEFKNPDGSVNAGAVVDVIGPTILAFSGHPILGALWRISESLFGFKTENIIKSITDNIRPLIEGGEQVDPQQVDAIVSNAVNANVPAASDTNPADDKIIKSFTLRKAKLFRISLDSFLEKNPNLNISSYKMQKKFGREVFGGLFRTASATTKSLLFTVISWIVKAILAGAGIMIIGKIVKHFVGNKNAPESSAPQSVQTKFKPNPNYSEEDFNGPNESLWVVNIDQNSFPTLLMHWAEEIYPALMGKDKLIESCSTFQKTLNEIRAFNKGGNSSSTAIPREWHSRKDIVDNFIDEVANRSPDAPKPTPAQKPVEQSKPVPNAIPAKPINATTNT